MLIKILKNLNYKVKIGKFYMDFRCTPSAGSFAPYSLTEIMYCAPWMSHERCKDFPAAYKMTTHCLDRALTETKHRPVISHTVVVEVAPLDFLNLHQPICLFSLPFRLFSPAPMSKNKAQWEVEIGRRSTGELDADLHHKILDDGSTLDFFRQPPNNFHFLGSNFVK